MGWRVINREYFFKWFFKIKFCWEIILDSDSGVRGNPDIYLVSFTQFLLVAIPATEVDAGLLVVYLAGGEAVLISPNLLV
jgi:hypothetical protein